MYALVYFAMTIIFYLLPAQHKLIIKRLKGTCARGSDKQFTHVNWHTKKTRHLPICLVFKLFLYNCSESSEHCHVQKIINDKTPDVEDLKVFFHFRDLHDYLHKLVCVNFLLWCRNFTCRSIDAVC